MDRRPDLDAASMMGALAFARLALMLVFGMNAVGYLDQPSLLYATGMLAAALAAGCAYLSQLLFTHDRNDVASLAQVLAMAAGAIGAVLFLVGY